MPRHSPPAVPHELIEQKIYLIRGHKVMLDSDLAELYRVTTGNLNLAVRRNPKRFPEDFMFQLSRERDAIFTIAKCKSKGTRWPTHTTIRLHRAGCVDALQRSQQRTSYRSEHCHRESVRAPPSDACHALRPR